MWTEWLGRTLDAHSAEDYAVRRARRSADLAMKEPERLDSVAVEMLPRALVVLDLAPCGPSR